MSVTRRRSEDRCLAALRLPVAELQTSLPLLLPLQVSLPLALLLLALLPASGRRCRRAVPVGS